MAVPGKEGERLEEVPGQRGHGGLARFAWETLQTFVIALVLALLIRQFAIESFVVDGPSMQPTLRTDERLLVNKMIYHLRPPRRGEVIVFRPPIDTDQDFVKRVVAVGGDTVQIRDGWVYVNGRRLDEPYVAYRGDVTTPPFKVPAGTVWVLGDNRPNSEDSRTFGEVSLADIRGEAILVWWPLWEAHLIH